MIAVFPFSLPTPTATYLVLYIATMAAHVALMSYVLAGSGLVVVQAMRGRVHDGPAAEVAGVLRDWLPFALGAAITAGVAPLLFVQVLYQESFYSANLLLFHRWMAVVPVLMLGFYLLYLNKSPLAARWSKAAQVGIAGAAFACFAFTGYSWIENHLLALDRQAWPGMYAAGEMVYLRAQSGPRALFWLALAVPLTVTILAWQMRGNRAAAAQPDGGEDGDGGETAVAGESTASAALARYLALVALVGVGVSVAAGVFYAYAVGRHALDTGAGLTGYRWALVIGGLVQAGAWAYILRVRRFDLRAMWTVTLAAVVTVVAVLALRESMRVAAMDIERVSVAHQRAAQADGMPLFVVFAVLAIGVMAWCFRMTRRSLASSEVASESDDATRQDGRRDRDDDGSGDAARRE